jgi:hypothetical protein
MYRMPHAAPESTVPEEKRGRTIGRFCKVCSTIYPEHRSRHRGTPMYGRDHIPSPCAHEGEAFEAGADWWEAAVEIVPEALKAGDGELVANSPAKGTAP